MKKVKILENPWDTADMKNGMLTDELISNVYPTNMSPFTGKHVHYTSYSPLVLKLGKISSLYKHRL